METLSVEEIRKLAKRVAADKLAPRAPEIDQNPSFPWQNICVLRQAGFHRLIIAESEEGMGHGRVCFAEVVREIAKACASTALVYVSHSIVAKAIELAGSELVKKRVLAEMLKGRGLGAFAVHEPGSGSNSGAITTRAKRDGDSYIMNGSKFFITSAGEADFYLVLVRTDPEKGPQGMSTFLIEKDNPGLSFGRTEDKMGLRSTSSKEMFFSDCQVPIDNLIGKEGEVLAIIEMGSKLTMMVTCK